MNKYILPLFFVLSLTYSNLSLAQDKGINNTHKGIENQNRKKATLKNDSIHFYKKKSQNDSLESKKIKQSIKNNQLQSSQIDSKDNKYKKSKNNSLESKKTKQSIKNNQLQSSQIDSKDNNPKKSQNNSLESKKTKRLIENNQLQSSKIISKNNKKSEN